MERIVFGDLAQFSTFLFTHMGLLVNEDKTILHYPREELDRLTHKEHLVTPPKFQTLLKGMQLSLIPILLKSSQVRFQQQYKSRN